MWYIIATLQLPNSINEYYILYLDEQTMPPMQWLLPVKHTHTHTIMTTLPEWLIEISNVLKKVSNCIELEEEEFSFLG